MKISHHIIAGSAGSLPIFWLTGSYEATVSFFLSNSFIDIDHFLDFWHDHGFHLSWKNFYQACSKADFVHFILVLHSFEVLILIFSLSLVLKNSSFYPYLIGISAGFSFHIILDIIGNKGIRIKYYWLFNRYKKKFKIDAIGNPELLNKKRKGITL